MPSVVGAWLVSPPGWGYYFFLFSPLYLYYNQVNEAPGLTMWRKHIYIFMFYAMRYRCCGAQQEMYCYSTYVQIVWKNVLSRGKSVCLWSITIFTTGSYCMWGSFLWQAILPSVHRSYQVYKNMYLVPGINICIKICVRCTAESPFYGVVFCAVFSRVLR